MTTFEVFLIGFALASFGLTGFCYVLARRLKKLNDLEHGLGAAIAVMTAEVTRLESAILAARNEATTATKRLAEEVEKAKHERAFWVLQRKFSDAEQTPEQTPSVRRRRRVRSLASREVAHEVV